MTTYLIALAVVLYALACWRYAWPRLRWWLAPVIAVGAGIGVAVGLLV